MVKRIRGVAYSTKVSPQNTNRMVDGARGLLNKLLADVFIFTDAMSGAASGNSPGYGTTLVAETTTGCLISAEACATQGLQSKQRATAWQARPGGGARGGVGGELDDEPLVVPEDRKGGCSLAGQEGGRRLGVWAGGWPLAGCVGRRVATGRVCGQEGGRWPGVGGTRKICGRLDEQMPLAR